MPVVHRRTVLHLAAAAGPVGLAAACTSARPPGDRRHVRPAPDPQLADLAGEQTLLDAYDATLARHPDLAVRLGPLRAHHAEHLAALRRMVGAAAGGPVPSPAASAPATPAGSAPVPDTPAGALAALRTAERAAAAARTRSCVAARRDRAALLGSIAACEASHEVLLA